MLKYKCGHRYLVGRGFRLHIEYFSTPVSTRPNFCIDLPVIISSQDTSIPYSRHQMAIIDGTASTHVVETIAPVDDHTTSHPDINIPSHTNEPLPETTETLHLDEGDVNVRTKIRTLAIVSALYFVLFIAALDQTIIA
jgi:hypothetical protein